MNLRKHVPLKESIQYFKQGELYWNGKLYEIHEDAQDILEWSCGHCDAHKHRIPKLGNILGGLCPDNDPTLDWKCFAEKRTSRILKCKK